MSNLYPWGPFHPKISVYKDMYVRLSAFGASVESTVTINVDLSEFCQWSTRL